MQTIRTHISLLAWEGTGSASMVTIDSVHLGGVESCPDVPLLAYTEEHRKQAQIRAFNRMNPLGFNSKTTDIEVEEWL